MMSLLIAVLFNISNPWMKFQVGYSFSQARELLGGPNLSLQVDEERSYLAIGLKFYGEKIRGRERTDYFFGFFGFGPVISIRPIPFFWRSFVLSFSGLGGILLRKGPGYEKDLGSVATIQAGTGAFETYFSKFLFSLAISRYFGKKKSFNNISIIIGVGLSLSSFY